MVFDGSISAVNCHSEVEDPPSFWSEISLDSHIYDSYVHRITLDTKSSVQLHYEWLTPPKLEEKLCAKERQDRIRGTFNISSSNSSQDISATKYTSLLTPKSQDNVLTSQDDFLVTDDNSLS